MRRLIDLSESSPARESRLISRQVRLNESNRAACHWHEIPLCTLVSACFLIYRSLNRRQTSFCLNSFTQQVWFENAAKRKEWGFANGRHRNCANGTENKGKGKGGGKGNGKRKSNVLSKNDFAKSELSGNESEEEKKDPKRKKNRKNLKRKRHSRLGWDLPWTWTRLGLKTSCLSR